MIGYYVHHQGRGHLSRALAIARALDHPVTALSSLPRAPEWPGAWVELPLDVADDNPEPTAGGRLHWAPLRVRGLSERMTAISTWLTQHGPDAFVADVSVEVAVLARLHGVPVVTVAQPGERADPAHALGYGLSDAIIAPWPAHVDGMLRGLPEGARSRLHPVGAIGCDPPLPDPLAAAPAERRVVLMAGAGGDVFSPAAVERARAQPPAWRWACIGGSGVWVDDAGPLLRAATVVVTHAGQNALADAAAARRPVLLLPQERPFAEQVTAARALAASAYPVVVRESWPTRGWRQLLSAAAALDGAAWSGWNDGEGARRAAAVVREVAAHATPAGAR